jgi:ribose 5-phosphate isomerase B
MRIALGSDERTVLTDEIADALRAAGHDVELFGPLAGGAEEWVAASAATARAVAEGRADRGVVCCWSGTGASIAANKVRGVRAALCNDLFTARLSREHNDANVLSMGGRIVAEGLASEILELWLTTPFDGGRHERRVAQIADIETEEGA